jgi:hypothetical protein
MTWDLDTFRNLPDITTILHALARQILGEEEARGLAGATGTVAIIQSTAAGCYATEPEMFDCLEAHGRAFFEAASDALGAMESVGEKDFENERMQELAFDAAFWLSVFAAARLHNPGLARETLERGLFGIGDPGLGTGRPIYYSHHDHVLLENVRGLAIERGHFSPDDVLWAADLHLARGEYSSSAFLADLVGRSAGEQVRITEALLLQLIALVEEYTEDGRVPSGQEFRQLEQLTEIIHASSTDEGVQGLFVTRALIASRWDKDATGAIYPRTYRPPAQWREGTSLVVSCLRHAVY